MVFDIIQLSQKIVVLELWALPLKVSLITLHLLVLESLRLSLSSLTVRTTFYFLQLQININISENNLTSTILCTCLFIVSASGGLTPATQSAKTTGLVGVAG